MPMYEPLQGPVGASCSCPNINLIEHNSITLLETNQPFIEAYMVGLNHEFARELLWREYPTDQRGSYFRQFWDVASFLDAARADAEALREQLRDIPPLHRWPRASELGEHDTASGPATTKEELVLVIRGELLKRYPNAVIYAHARRMAAQAGRRRSTARKERALRRRSTPAEEDNPPRTKVRTPLYEAKVDPDIYFFGFDLTVEARRAAGRGEQPRRSAGWFFVIKERPGEPRFGFDETSDAADRRLERPRWDRVPTRPARFIRAVGGRAARHPGASPAGQAEKDAQRQDDVQVTWDATSAPPSWPTSCTRRR